MPLLFSFKNRKDRKSKNNQEYYALVSKDNKSAELKLFVDKRPYIPLFLSDL
jgi:hypothetical protein